MARTPKGVIPHRQAMKVIMVQASEGGLKDFRENPSPKKLKPVMAAIQAGLLDLITEAASDTSEKTSSKVTKPAKATKTVVAEEPVKTRKRRKSAEAKVEVEPVKTKKSKVQPVEAAPVKTKKKHKARIEEKPAKRASSKSSW